MANNPDLERLRQEVALAKRQLELERSIFAKRQSEPTMGEAAARFGRSGFTFGFGDEMQAGYEGAKSFLNTPGGIGDRGEAAKLGYEASYTKQKARDMALRREFPKTAFASEAVGGGVIGGGTGYMAREALSQLPASARLIGLGAVEGGLFGAGTSDPGRRGEGALFGAIVGAGATPIFQGLAVATMNVLRPVAKRLGQALAGTPRDRAVREVIKALDADDITVKEASIMLKEMGPKAVLADLGDTLARSGRVVTSELGPAASKTKRFLDTRQLESQTQLRQVARKAAAGNGFDQGVVEIINNAESAAAPLYREVYSQVIDVSPEMLHLLQRPAMLSARKRAVAKLRNEGFSGDIINDVTDVRYMDGVKRALQDQESVLIRKGANDEARVLGNLRRQFVAEIDAQVPDYAKARNIFAGEAQIREAVDIGETAFKGRNMNATDFDEIIKDMTDGEKQGARIGFLRWLRDELANTSTSRSTVARNFAEKPRFSQMAKSLFPDQNALKQFLEEASAQSRFAQTRNMVTGGSPTARIQQDVSALTPGLARTLVDSSATPGGMIAGALQLIRGNTKLTPEVLKEMQKLLFDPSIIPQSKLRPNPLVSMFQIPRVPPGVSAGVSAGIVGSQQGGLVELGDTMGLLGK